MARKAPSPLFWVLLHFIAVACAPPPSLPLPRGKTFSPPQAVPSNIIRPASNDPPWHPIPLIKQWSKMDSQGSLPDSPHWFDLTPPHPFSASLLPSITFSITTCQHELKEVRLTVQHKPCGTFDASAISSGRLRTRARGNEKTGGLHFVMTLQGPVNLCLLIRASKP